MTPNSHTPLSTCRTAADVIIARGKKGNNNGLFTEIGGHAEGTLHSLIRLSQPGIGSRFLFLGHSGFRPLAFLMFGAKFTSFLPWRIGMAISTQHTLLNRVIIWYLRLETSHLAFS
jgi:hypothetical protein